MTVNHSSPEDEDESPGGKKPYEQPRFQYEDVFVTSALSCAKAFDQSTCMFQSPRSS
jgi:hypothetical protein